MGDIVTLVEKAEEEAKEEEAEKLMRKLKAETFDLEDFLGQLQQMKKIGPISKMLDYLPVDPSLRNVDFSEERYKQVEAVILSMTPEERTNPRMIDGRRRKRIANKICWYCGSFKILRSWSYFEFPKILPINATI